MVSITWLVMARVAPIGQEGHMTKPIDQQSFGEQLRSWRQRRHLSQLDLALEADISARHLSFIETGRSRPSREMVMRLAECLALPLRGCNALLLAAGFAPAYRERGLDDPELESARIAVQRILDGHDPYPALAVDRHWNLMAHNAAVPLMLAGAAPHLVERPCNVLRLSLHPDGLAPRIRNLGEWKRHLLQRLDGQIWASADPVLEEIRDELRGYPAPASKAPHGESAAIVVPMELDSPLGTLSFFSTTTVFGTPVEVTLSEIAIEAFFPADAETAEKMRAIVAAESARKE
jgi:transcriptional regulator with XRE-family HTH domain